MTYQVQRWRGYEPWAVMSPWVFANYGQPQRHRGYVSPIVFQSKPPQLMSPHLGALGAAQQHMVAAQTAAYHMHPAARPTRHAVTQAKMALGQATDEAAARAARMEKIAITGLVLSSLSLGVYVYTTAKVLKRNGPKKKRARSRSGTCAYCGEKMFLTSSGVSHHGSPGAVDYDADADHVALDDRDYGKL